MNNYCAYYQAYLDRPKIVYIIGILKSFDHLCFDRALDAQTNLFEFFVPETNQKVFLDVMHYFEKEGFVKDLKGLPNRLEQEEF